MKRHVQWLMELTAIPTAAGREDRVIKWVEQWVDAHQGISLKRDQFGNLLLKQTRASSKKPIYITAHLDHPAFVVRKQIDDRHLELEFRGGVNDAYFIDAKVEVFDNEGNGNTGTITSISPKAKPFKRVVVRLQQPIAGILLKGDVARWKLKPPTIKNGLLHAPACDDLAGVAAAIAALDVIRNLRGLGHVGVLLTRAEEIGFVGAIAAAKHKTIQKSSRLLCLETSRSFPESPIGAGPILRVGDKTSVFGPELTNTIAEIMKKYQATQKKFKWQRKLMPGGTCESTAFCAYGYLSTCLCLPLGNYHNMRNIDGVLQKRKAAKIGPEIISIDDFQGLITMLTVVCSQLDKRRSSSLMRGLESRFRSHKKLITT
jgi:putative aminopeptidase FrvX